MKVSIIGAGQVGGLLAYELYKKKFDIVLIDIVLGIALGKAIDISHNMYDRNMYGGSDYSKIKDSDIVVICAAMDKEEH